jgi:hypothetical protein
LLSIIRKIHHLHIHSLSTVPLPHPAHPYNTTSFPHPPKDKLPLAAQVLVMDNSRPLDRKGNWIPVTGVHDKSSSALDTSFGLNEIKYRDLTFVQISSHS